jgi:hypothetical protein
LRPYAGLQTNTIQEYEKRYEKDINGHKFRHNISLSMYHNCFSPQFVRSILSDIESKWSPCLQPVSPRFLKLHNLVRRAGLKYGKLEGLLDVSGIGEVHVCMVLYAVVS